jgi:flagellar basal body-associated protein FliL
MAKKAKLDILEVSIDNKDDDIPSPEREPDKAEEAVPVELVNQERSITKIKAWLRIHLLRLILVSFLLIGLIVGAIIWYLWKSEKPAAVEHPRPALSEIPQTVKGGIVYLEGFAVDQKDDKGEFRIAFCDIAIELGKHELAKDLVDRVDVRNVVYTVLKSKKAEEGLLVEKRNLLKAEIKSDLNRLLGEDAVSQVYFTKYELN